MILSEERLLTGDEQLAVFRRLKKENTSDLPVSGAVEDEALCQEQDKKTLRQVVEILTPYIDHKEDCLIYRQNYLDALWDSKDTDRIECECTCNIEAIKQSLLEAMKE